MLYNNYPSIDLHGETGEISKILVRDFIYDNFKQKNEYICIIHGIGKGIVKRAVHEELKNNKYVDSFKQDYFNEGMTIVKIISNIH